MIEMTRAATVSASPQNRTKPFPSRFGRVAAWGLLIVVAGFFMAGVFSHIGRIIHGNPGPLGADFFVLFAGGALYAAGLLFIWYSAALALTRLWLDRIVTRLEAEARNRT
jgi:hypothetical protein